jgi:YesN/AraC family two-component response regulator
MARAIARSPASGPLVGDVAGILQHLVAGSGRLDGPDIVSLVRDFLDHHYGQPIALSALGDRLGFDESYVTRRFKSATGEPPIRYLTRVRVEHAKRLLRDRLELDVGEIGRIVGYPDQHYFCRVFRKLTGANPTEYRGSPTPEP